MRVQYNTNKEGKPNKQTKGKSIIKNALITKIHKKDKLTYLLTYLLTYSLHGAESFLSS